MSGTRGDDKKNPRVVIQDVLIASMQNYNPPPVFATGEYDDSSKFGGVKLTAKREDPDSLIDRLYTQIDAWVQQGARQHRKNCVADSNQLLPGKENTITRLLTNEFFFYTREPLTMDHFGKLMQRLESLAKSQPENLHLILGSFAVRTPDNKIMNIVPHIECGKNPIINFSVKNYPSDGDPKYSELSAGKAVTPTIPLPNIDVNKGDKVSNLAITINGQHYPLSFYNTYQCKTAGGALFHSCIEICLDHTYGVAKRELDKKFQIDVALAELGKRMEQQPIQCAHTIISNHTPLFPQYFIGDITHVDPHGSHQQAKQHMPPSDRYTLKQSTFGTPAEVLIMPPVYCESLAPYELELVNHFNKVQQFIAEFIGSEADLPDAIDDQFSSERKLLNLSWQADQLALKYEGNEVVVAAVKENNADLVKYLLDKKLDPNAQSRLGVSLLSIAISNYSSKMVALLLSYGANPHLRDKSGVTPYNEAVQLKADEIQESKDYEEAFDPNLLKKLDTILEIFDKTATNKAAPVVISAAMSAVIDDLDNYIEKRSKEGKGFELFGGSKKEKKIEAAKFLKALAEGKAELKDMKPHFAALLEGNLNTIYLNYLDARKASIAAPNKKPGLV